MPRFFFDLLIGNVVMLDPGGMVHEHVDAAVGAADRMARHLFIWRADLRDCDAWVRVRDGQGREIYRTAVWSGTARREGWDQA
jgi:hypothetical protein